MPVITLVIVPAIAGIVFLCLAAGGVWLSLGRGRALQSAATAGPLRRDALTFAVGAVLLAGFFLFNAVFVYVMG